MSDFHLRPSRTEDTPALKALWQTVFGDPPEVIDRYFHLVYTPGAAAVAERDGRVCGAFHLMEGSILHREGGAEKCAYLYALAALPEVRGEGLGARLTRYASELASARGAQFSVLRPANARLDRWYRASCGAIPVFPRYTLAAQGRRPTEGRCVSVTPAEYAALRESLLDGTPHVSFPVSHLALQSEFSALSGGGLVRVEVDGAVGCAVAERSPEGLLLRELLFPSGDMQRALHLLMNTFHADAARALLPPFWPAPASEPAPGLLLIPGGAALPALKEAYWGLYWE